MNKEELERRLRESPMAYPLKVNLYCKGVAFTPCNDCPFKNENPVVPIWKKTEKCFQRCPFEILIWILNEEQQEMYEKLRPPEMKEREIKRAQREGKIAKMELREQEVTAAPVFFCQK